MIHCSSTFPGPARDKCFSCSHPRVLCFKVRKIDYWCAAAHHQSAVRIVNQRPELWPEHCSKLGCWMRPCFIDCDWMKTFQLVLSNSEFKAVLFSKLAKIILESFLAIWWVIWSKKEENCLCVSAAVLSEAGRNYSVVITSIIFSNFLSYSLYTSLQLEQMCMHALKTWKILMCYGDFKVKVLARTSVRSHTHTCRHLPVAGRKIMRQRWLCCQMSPKLFAIDDFLQMPCIHVPQWPL